MNTQPAETRHPDHGISDITTPTISFLSWKNDREIQSYGAGDGKLLGTSEGLSKTIGFRARLMPQKLKVIAVSLILTVSLFALSGCGKSEGCSKTGGGGRSQSCSCNTGRYNCVIVDLTLLFGIMAAVVVAGKRQDA